MVFQKRLYQFARICWSAVPVDTIAKICCPFAARNLVYILPAVFMSEGHNLHSVQLICWMDDANKTIRYWWANSPYDSVAWQQDTLFFLCLIFSPKKKSFFKLLVCEIEAWIWQKFLTSFLLFPDQSSIRDDSLLFSSSSSPPSLTRDSEVFATFVATDWRRPCGLPPSFFLPE